MSNWKKLYILNQRSERLTFLSIVNLISVLFNFEIIEWYHLVDILKHFCIIFFLQFFDQ